MNGSKAVEVVASEGLRCARISRASGGAVLALLRLGGKLETTVSVPFVFLDNRTIFSSRMNVSGTLSFFRLFRDPSLCLPHHTVSTFNHLPIPLSRAFNKADGEKKVDIRAVVLDKDNCFAVPKENEIYKPYTVRFNPSSFSINMLEIIQAYLIFLQERFEELRKAYPGSRLLIVSNSAGTLSDPTGAEADLLEKNTGVKVLRHNTKVCLSRFPLTLHN